MRAWWFLAGWCVVAGLAMGSGEALGARRVVHLDGTWRAAQGSMEAVPAAFEHEVAVPGLIDMAKPAFEEAGKVSDNRQVFWYRRTFAVEGDIPAVAMLKVHKARYCTKVWLNGQAAGEHLPCFTPGYFDLKRFIKGGGAENELVIRIGANRESVPTGQPSGWDFEKYLYVPGIYDSVELVLTEAPYIVNVQTAPDIEGGRVRVVVELKGAGTTAVVCEVSEDSSGKAAGSATLQDVAVGDGVTTVETTVAIEGCRLWSPEDPFLYRLHVWTSGDAATTRFGMRSFRFDAESGRAILNGKPYMMRGTNVCAYRFFEDSQRGDKPWRAEWVRRLHRKFKGMHWNSIRYCIGFPPELWYDIADEEGFLIQDEFPIWLLNKAPEAPVAEKIIPEYTEWMRERWNHACVVIWDAQNESVTKETGKALTAVRGLDLSNRPWDNGWAEPQTIQDCVEAHPYLFIRSWNTENPFMIKEVANTSPAPHLRGEQQALAVPIVINEYAWLWLNRDGTPTTLTKNIYESLGLWPGSTTEQRRRLYARYLAALTEFWRAHRKCAGVLHFCGLGYSRPGFEERPLGGATSDHFIDIEKLEFEPMFEQYVRDAFAPVGVMLDFWDDRAAAGARLPLKVYVTNDLYEAWDGAAKLVLLRDGQVVAEQIKACRVDALGSKVVSFEQAIPEAPGDYQLAAELVVGLTQAGTRSLRDFTVR